MVDNREARRGGTNRRGFLGGAAAGTAAHALGISPAAAGAVAPRCAGRPPGVRRSALALSHDGRTLWAADTGATTISAHRARDLAKIAAIDVGAAPTAIALTPDGHRALVTTGFYDAPGLAIVDLRARKVTARLDVGAAPEAVALAPDGRTASVAAGGAKGRLTRVDLQRGRVMARVDVGRHPRGVAITADGRRVLVALNGDAAVAVVSLHDDHVLHRIPTAPFPFLLTAAPHGDRAFVSHNGLGAALVTRLDVRAGLARGTIATGAEPAGLAFAGAGTLLVAARGDGTVTGFDAGSGRRRRRTRTGGRPRALVARGRRAWTADEETGQLWGIRA